MKELKPEEIVDFSRAFSNEASTQGRFEINQEDVELLQESDTVTFAARAVAAGSASDYLIEGGDAKIYSLDLQAGIFLQAQLKQPINPALDYDLYILDAEGNILSYSEYYTNINWTGETLPEAAGYITTAASTYYLYVLSGQGGSVDEAYTLEYSIGNACDNYEIDDNASQSLGFTYGLGGAYIENRNLSSPIDNDWYTFTIPSTLVYNRIKLAVSTASANKCEIEVYRNTVPSGFKMVKQSFTDNELMAFWSFQLQTVRFRIMRENTLAVLTIV